MRAYFDNNATTRPSDEVVAAMMPYFTELFANASSAAGQVLGVDRVTTEAKRAVGALLGSSDLGDDIVLTSGASESNSWAIKGVPLAEGDVVVSSVIEHPSVHAALAAVERRGVQVRLVPCDRNGVIDEAAFRLAVAPGVRLVSVMIANNETGAVQPVGRLAEIARAAAPQCVIHCDMTQALGRVAVDLTDSLYDVDLASFSAHKFHGPKGIGGLFIRSGTRIGVLLEGEQEGGRRGGTINTPGAAGMAKAAHIAKLRLPEMERVCHMRGELEQVILRRISSALVNGSHGPRLPNTSSITVRGLDAAEAVDELARRGICIANGSACSAGSDAPSHVLTAMGVSYADAFQTLRVSLSVDTTPEEIEMLVSELTDLAADR